MKKLTQNINDDNNINLITNYLQINSKIKSFSRYYIQGDGSQLNNELFLNQDNVFYFQKFLTLRNFEGISLSLNYLNDFTNDDRSVYNMSLGTGVSINLDFPIFFKYILLSPSTSNINTIFTFGGYKFNL